MQSCLPSLTSPKEGQLSPDLAKLNRDKLNHSTPTFFAKGTLEKSGTADITFTSTAAPIVLTEIARKGLYKALSSSESAQVFYVLAPLSGLICIPLTIKVSHYLLASSLTLMGPKVQFSLAFVIGTGLGGTVCRFCWLNGNAYASKAEAETKRAVEELKKTYEATMAPLPQGESFTCDQVAIVTALCKAGIPSENADDLVLLLLGKKGEKSSL